MNRITHEASARTATKWAGKFRQATKVLETLPEIGAPVEDLPFPGLREQLIGPYRLIYRYETDECVILTIVRAERDLRGAISPEDLE